MQVVLEHEIISKTSKRVEKMRLRPNHENEADPENKIFMSFSKSKNDVRPAVIAAMIFPGKSCWLHLQFVQ